MIQKLTLNIIILLHILLVCVPLVTPFLNFSKKTLKILLLLTILVPYHWPFFNNQCSVSIVQKNMGDLKNNNNFSEKYLKWIYNPIMKLFGWKWDEIGVTKMATIHWIINILLIYYALYKKIKNNKKQLKILIIIIISPLLFCFFQKDKQNGKKYKNYELTHNNVFKSFIVFCFIITICVLSII